MGSRLEANSNAVRKRIESHTFEDEHGEEYEGSKFGGFPEYFRRKKIKLQNLDAELRSQSVDKPKIFRGVVAHVNGFTQPSLNDLHRLVVSYGGGFMQYLDGKTTVTHIIAANLTPKKVEEFRKYRIVKPAWIVDSVEAGRLLPWDHYRVIDEGTAQKILLLDNGKVSSRITDRTTGYRDQTDASWYTSQLSKPEIPIQTQLPTPDRSSQPKSDHEEDIAQNIVDSESKRKIPAEIESFSFDDDFDDLLLAVPENQKESASIDLDQKDPKVEGINKAVVSDENLLISDAVPHGLKRKASAEALPDISSPTKSKLTAEEHNAILLADPRIRKSSTLNPDFLEQYYRESRLHHLSTWKADLKSQLQALTAEKSASQQQRRRRPHNARRYILHVDFDSFFVAVSLKNCPQYADRPACVAHGGGSGSEIASCNYPAREFGVKNGMWMKRAQELCKDLKVLPYDFPAYEAASRKFYDAILATGGFVQSVSIDEALVDVTDFCIPAGGTDGIAVQEGSICREQAKADDIAQDIRDQVKHATGCAVSVGIGGNILLAKVALRKAKPAGQYQVKPEEVLEFLGNLEVQDLPGIAHNIGGKLEEIGIKYVKDIRDTSKERLLNVLGPKTGEKMHNYSRGIDRTEVGDQVVRKSVSAEVNWGVRFETQEQAEEFIESLCSELTRRLVKERVVGKQMTMKIMRRAADAPLDPPKHLGHGKCDTFNKSIVLGVATNAAEVLSKQALSILRGFGFSPGELRGLGVQMTRLEPIKVSFDGETNNSQRKLRFKSAVSPTAESMVTEKAAGDVIIDDGISNTTVGHPERPTTNATLFKPQAPSDDPIQDDPQTPRKSHTTSAIPAQPLGVGPSVDSPHRKPLNMLGTQFILPSQVDPGVLAELPSDIRAKLFRQGKQNSETLLAKTMQQRHEAQLTAVGPKTCQVASTILPSESQLDPEALQALPDDVREEILAHYATSPTSNRTRNTTVKQTRLPQSPHKNRSINTAPRRGASARGRPRGSSLLSRLKGVSSRAFSESSSTLTQANFVTTSLGRRAPSNDHKGTDSEGGGGGGGGEDKAEIAADFLAALPEDIRKEVLGQRRKEQLRRHGGLQINTRRRGHSGAAGQKHNNAPKQQQTAAVRGERVWTLDAWPQKPSFTARKLTDSAELRQAVEEWVDVFRTEGPYEEDVTALGRYLGDVVTVERDMGKAVGVVEWMGWVVGGLDGEHNQARGKEKWTRAFEVVKGLVKESVSARGLGEMHFDSFA